MSHGESSGRARVTVEGGVIEIRKVDVQPNADATDVARDESRD